jgi:hypothetical protein
MFDYFINTYSNIYIIIIKKSIFFDDFYYFNFEKGLFMYSLVFVMNQYYRL